MWMEGDGVDGGENVLNATPSSFLSPPCLVWTNPRVVGTCRCDIFPEFLHQENHSAALFATSLIALIFNSGFLIFAAMLCNMKCVTAVALHHPFLNGKSASVRTGNHGKTLQRGYRWAARPVVAKQSSLRIVLIDGSARQAAAMLPLCRVELHV